MSSPGVMETVKVEQAGLAICWRWSDCQLLPVCNTLDSSSSFLTTPSAGKKEDANQHKS